jgi:hypothetical protein
MLSGFCLESISQNIRNEDDLINIFDYLIKEGLTPYEAYYFITDKYGEEEILKLLDEDNFRFC